MRRIRTFIAIDPGKHIRERLIALQESLMRGGADAKWVEPENLHVTLQFLGEVDLPTIPDVCNAVAEAVADHGAFPMTVEKTGCFPNARRPRVLWAGVGQGAQEVAAVHGAIEERLLDLGCYRREERKYTPHITLGRVKGDRNATELGTVLAKYADWKGGETTVKEIHVMSSELMPRGPIYTVLSRAKLP
jgi:2'-5' RNA ligase